jgi:hypothetical protein
MLDEATYYDSIIDYSSSEQFLLELEFVFRNHNGGALAF